MGGRKQQLTHLAVLLGHEAVYHRFREGKDGVPCALCGKLCKGRQFVIIDATGAVHSNDPANLRPAHRRCAERKGLDFYQSRSGPPPPQRLTGLARTMAKALVWWRDEVDGKLTCSYGAGDCPAEIDRSLPSKSRWGLTINHIDGNPFNNDPDNLEGVHLSCNSAMRKRVPPESRKVDAQRAAHDRKRRTARQHASGASRPSGKGATRTGAHTNTQRDTPADASSHSSSFPQAQAIVNPYADDATAPIGEVLAITKRIRQHGPDAVRRVLERHNRVPFKSLARAVGGIVEAKAKTVSEYLLEWGEPYGEKAFLTIHVDAENRPTDVELRSDGGSV